MMRLFTADLHVHTLLSPCAAVEMTPRHIVWQAMTHGIHMIAITDHNACDNVCAAMDAAAGTGVTVIPGMEVETKEEVHLLALFEDMSQLVAWESFIISRRCGRNNDEKKFGAQFIVDAEDNLVGVKEELLLSALNAGLSEAVQKIAALGGIAIASHVDRPAYSVLSQLGFIPQDAGLAAAEISRLTPWEEARERLPGLCCLPIIASSDAHCMDDFINGPKTSFLLETPSLSEIRLALAHAGGRQTVGAIRRQTPGS